MQLFKRDSRRIICPLAEETSIRCYKIYFIDTVCKTKKKHRHYRAFVNTRLLVHKHVKISVDEWILETTRPQKTCQIFGTIYSINFQSQNQTLEGRKMKNVALFWQFADTLISHLGHVCCGHFVSCVLIWPASQSSLSQSSYWICLELLPPSERKLPDKIVSEVLKV